MPMCFTSAPTADSPSSRWTRWVLCPTPRASCRSGKVPFSKCPGEATDTRAYRMQLEGRATGLTAVDIELHHQMSAIQLADASFAVCVDVQSVLPRHLST